ncbi:MAG: hypothetical protein QM473_15225 [Acidobacteriota bacterium]|nr:hypothetical protein [Acidobacteriota bacterium]
MVSNSDVQHNSETALAHPDTSYRALAQAVDVAEVVTANLGFAGLNVHDLDKVKIPAGGALTFELPTLQGTVAVDELRGIIIGMVDYRTFFAGAFTGDGSPPDCSSADGIYGVGTPGGACARCPKAAWGSAENGRGQACSARTHLLLLRPGSMLPLVVDLPSSSLAALRKYLLRLTDAGHVFHQVQTAIALEAVKNAGGIRYSRAAFAMAGELAPDLAARAAEYARALEGALKAREVEVENLAEAAEHDLRIGEVKAAENADFTGDPFSDE